MDANKTILITGSTDGIGKLTASRFAKEGYTVILHGRNSNKLQATITELIDTTKNNQIKGYVSDFSNLKSVKAMANEILGQHTKIDVLVNNAGIFKSPASKTVDGLDIRFSVNYFAPFILTNILSPLIEESHSSRIINISSAAQAPVSLNALVGNESLSDQEAYAQSKLALTMWSFHLAKLKPSVGIITVNPGSLLNTKMVQEAYGQYWSSAEKGASIIYGTSLSETYNNISGEYFDNDKGELGQAHPDSYDQEKINALISSTESFLNNL